MCSLQELLESIKFPNKGKTDLITHAYYYAEKAHASQKRYSGKPYFTHVFETAKILAELGMSRRTISAGLLHDVLEDAGVSDEDFEKEFGKEILFLVQGVTKLGKIRYSEKNERHVESLRKFFVAMSLDIRVMIIKLADRLHNMRTLFYVPEEKRRRIALETMEIYIPLAYRMGMRKIKREMEDLAFQYIYPEKYEEIKKMLKEYRKEKVDQLEKFRRSLLKALAKDGVINVITDNRMKSYYSVYKKMQAKERDIDKIYDISALRINVENVADCYKVLGIIHGLWRPLPGRIKDYIAFPKPNGYRSIHTTVFTGSGAIVEIQIRTHHMHQEAELGLVSHIAYKEQGRSEDPHYSWFKQFFPSPKKEIDLTKNLFSGKTIDEERLQHIPVWIKELVDVQSYISFSTEFMDNLKQDFFQHRMFIFDSKGDLIDLPITSCVIDYAYAMDVQSADRLYGAKVNGKFVPLETELNNGDIVELTIKKNGGPNAKWLNYCKTTFAKKHIREALAKNTSSH
jgi:GTP pyrophosphokinase